MSRPRWSVVIVAAFVALTGCTQGDSGAGSVPPPETNLNTFVILEGVPDPVPVDGEPPIEDRMETRVEHFPRDGRVDFVVAIPPSWANPEGQGDICRWTEEAGLHYCTSLSVPGTATTGIEIPGLTEPGETVEFWLYSGMVPTRRLYVGPSPAAGVVHELVLKEPYESLADVLTRQPPPDGNYMDARERTP